MGRTVLVVEDDQALRKLVAGLLEASGYRVLPASSGEEAIAAADSFGGEIHLLLTDLRLGGMNGLGLAAHIAVARPDIAILVISGYTEIPIPPGLKDTVRAEFLTKPFTQQRLLDKVDGMLKPPLEASAP